MFAHDRGNSFFNRLLDYTSYWPYLVVGFFLLFSFLSVAALGIWYLRQQGIAQLPTASRPPASARISVDPPSGGPGMPVRVSGQGWPAGDVVFISLEAPFRVSQHDFAYAGAVVNDQGQFQVSFTFPQEERWANAGAIKVIAWAEQSGAKAVTIFQVVQDALSSRLEPKPMSSEPTVLAQLTSSLTEQAKAATPPVAGWPALPAQNWYGEYFAGPTLSGSPVFLRDDRDIDFDWQEGSPGEKLGADRFSVRWTRDVTFAAGVYRFLARADDGIRLWVDDKLVIDQWHEGSTTTYVADVYLWEGVHRLRVEYYELDGKASVRLWWEKLEVFPDWKGEYFSNSRLVGQPVLVRNDPQIRFNWGNQAPAPGVRPDDFSARWSRRTRFEPGRHRFYIYADDGMRIWLDDVLIIDLWQNVGPGLRTADLSLEGGDYRVQVEYYNAGGEARAEIWWERFTMTPTVYPSTPPAFPMAAASPPGAETPMMVHAQAYAARPVQSPSAESTPGAAIIVPLPPSVLTSMPTVSAATPDFVPPTFGLPLPAAPAASPMLSVRPSEIALGAEVTVKGQGWPAGEEVIIALVEPGADLTQAPPLAQTIVGADGAFEASLLVPDEEKWRDDSELIVLAHSVDWTVRLVSPLRLSAPAATYELRSVSRP